MLVRDTTYVMSGKTWRPAATNTRSRSYATLAAHVRWGSSVTNVTTLLRSSTSLRKTGLTYKGTVPIARLSQAPDLGPVYAELARVTGAQQVTFAVRLDRAKRPLQVWVGATGPGDKPRTQTLQTTYSRWGQKVAIAAPRGAG
jgi:serine/threonine-protein kinase